MAQHFLLSAKARTLSLAKVMRLSDEDALATFKAIRWANNDGQPFCPKCGCVAIYSYASRPIFKCKGCEAQFSVTSGTIFASRKLAIRDILAAIAIFVNGAKGISALQLSRDLDVQYKTAFVLAHKIREAMAAEVQAEEMSGEVEIDGAYFGGYVKPANRKGQRRDRRLLENRTGKRRVVVIMRERNGTTLPSVHKAEGDAVQMVARTVKPGSTIYADEASHWDALHARFLTKRINHSESYAEGETSTNMAESFFSRLRRAEIGTHHHISGRYLHSYANEMAWRENNRRVSNGEQFLMAVNASLVHPVSRQWKGYWQRRTIAR
ncbi:MAG: IS1595 family transposase [Parvibaculum sp.]|uniref:IS1595 family transposase n=1 Tax=Parvibaculum sp. TaxID=2024848 RepID=UPI00284AD3DE|nr:IS1595 family transposase [Parvibaculum sp.]MDR3500667.1 IS1595 family transposase [Parvibaculum sp.]